jgi:hypothetical protein
MHEEDCGLQCGSCQLLCCLFPECYTTPVADSHSACLSPIRYGYYSSILRSGAFSGCHLFAASILGWDAVSMKPKLILCLALVLSGISFGCSTAAKHSTVVVTSGPAAGAKRYFEDYLVHCDTNAINCLWFLQNDPRIGMVMTIHLDQETVFTVRDFYGHAEQSFETRRLSHPQVLTLKQIISNLPPSDKKADFNKSVLISIRNGKNAEVFQYDRHHTSAIIQRIYDIGGGYLETNTVALPAPSPRLRAAASTRRALTDRLTAAILWGKTDKAKNLQECFWPLFSKNLHFDGFFCRVGENPPCNPHGVRCLQKTQKRAVLLTCPVFHPAPPASICRATCYEST